MPGHFSGRIFDESLSIEPSAPHVSRPQSFKLADRLAVNCDCLVLHLYRRSAGCLSRTLPRHPLSGLLRRSFRTAKHRHFGGRSLRCRTGADPGNRRRCSGWSCDRRHRRLVHHSQRKKFRLIDRANVDRGFADPSLVQARSCRRNMSVGQSASESP